MGEAEPTALYPGTYYLCFEKNGGSVLRMDRPRTDTIKFGIVFVADPRRICDARHFDMVVLICSFFFLIFLLFILMKKKPETFFFYHIIFHFLIHFSVVFCV